ncbi:uncharacterized protein LOC105186402 [Harpegnathos saltator]|uniref:Uncharacterized protein n=1 Tax=Harpegnathos saltator TaxID=610380 RepID=E2BTH4_HARSA|nr:uncharacterized protein LOC105186402 [Harpegnathos saltator]EFN81002.1 hypothetical protein EAI_12848 [Harpegnathos saltator]
MKNERTLLDYNGPEITEDMRSNQDLADHVRVKRSESTNDSFPLFWSKNGTTVAFDQLLSKSYIDSNHKVESEVIDVSNRTYLRHKRGVLPRNGQHRKRVKGNIRHPKYRIKAEVGGKKRGTLKSSRKFPRKKTDAGQRRKNTEINVRTSRINESQTESKMKKRESENRSLNSSNIAETGSTDYERMEADKSETLINQSDSISSLNNNGLKEQREENIVVLPFVHTGKAELRVRIEKIPTNESSFINTNSWIDHPITISPSSIMSTRSQYGAIDEINNTVTNIELTPSFNYTEKREKEMDDPTKFISLGTDQNQKEDDKYKHTDKKFAEFADEDMKYRTKRNQEIMSKRYLHNNINTTKSRHFKDTGQIIGDTKRKRTIYRKARGNRAVRSIEEIKELVEKLVVKVNELQMYVSNYSETPHTTTGSCVSEQSDRVPRLSENLNYKSKFVRDVDNHERLTNNRQADTVEERAFQIPSSASRITRANSQGRRKRLRKWNRWTDWSSCSVTCGKGRQIRWRHCLRDCDDAEIEMEEKACQLPACPPGKFLGIF